MRWIVIVALVFMAGCATSSGTDSGAGERSDNTGGPLNEPPGENEPASMPDGPDVILPEENRAASPEASARAGAEDETSVTRSEVDAFMERGPSYVLTVVTVEPSRDEAGKFVGHQIVDVTREARAFMMPEIQVGDVVTHVNGVRLVKPDDLIDAWKSLRKVDSVRVDFERQGEPMQAIWSIR